MRIDPIYIKELLTLAQEADNASFKSSFLKENSDSDNIEKFAFHLEILADKGVLVKEADNSRDLGISRDNGGRIFYKPGLRIRLTAQGHDFIEALQNETVWNKIKKDLKKPSITTLMNFSQFAFQEYLKSNVF